MKTIKEIIYQILLSFITMYMLFMFEPIVMYSGNTDDFYFDLYTILPSLIIITLILTIVASIIYLFIYLISKKKQWNHLIDIITLIHFAVFLILYIHGNFLSTRLTMLDGSSIVWSNYTIDMIASAFIIIIITAFIILGVKALEYKKTVKITRYITYIIFIMLTTALISTMLTNQKVLEQKNFLAIATTRDYNTYSKDINFIIFVSDSVDSQAFNKVLNNSKYKDLFEDFVYFPDTMSGYSGSKNSVPLMLTGMWDDNSYYYDEYLMEAYKQSKLFKDLNNNEYNMNFYDDGFRMYYDDAKQFSNFVFLGKNINTFDFFMQEIKYISFKYMPFFLKPFSRIDTFSLSGKNISGIKNDYYDWHNIENYKNITENNIEVVDTKQFKYIHMEGAHVPYTMDSELNIVKESTYEQKIEATLKIYEAYIKKLKENNMYDNSIIIVLADHGASKYTNFWGRQNPMFLIKGINEHHEYNVSDEALTYENLITIFEDLMNGKKATELSSNVDDSGVRRFLFYPDNYDKTIVEYKTTGKAWDLDSLKETGAVYKPYSKKASK